MSVRVLCAGLSTVDLVYRVDRIPGVDEKAQAESVEVGAGGPAVGVPPDVDLGRAEVVLIDGPAPGAGCTHQARTVDAAAPPAVRDALHRLTIGKPEGVTV